jgi:hypothetical protein
MLNAAIFELGSEEVTVTASFGVAALGGAVTDFETVLAAADRAVYEAKSAGRNRCSLAGGMPKTPEKRRVFKGGQIMFNGRTSTMDCTVRKLSSGGAELQVSSTTGVPKSFDLAIKCDGIERRCRVVTQSEKVLDVSFV